MDAFAFAMAADMHPSCGALLLGLNSVAEQVMQHLLQPQPVGAERAGIGGEIMGKTNRTGGALMLQQVTDMPPALGQIYCF